MLELKSLAEFLESRLNLTLKELNSELLFTNRYEFAFKVSTDIGEHKGYDYIDTNGNVSIEKTSKLRRYIECELSQIDSSVQATTFINIIRNTQLQILIPLNDIELLEEQNNVVDNIRQAIDESFSRNGTGSVLENDTVYSFSFDYSLSNTGERATRMFTGDSVILTAYINFYYVEQGLESRNISISIDGELIRAIRIGISRAITGETNTYSNDTRAVAMNTPTSSLFNINFDMVARKSGISVELYKYALTSKNLDFANRESSNVAHYVKIEIFLGDTSVVSHKLMNFDNVGLSAQEPLIASLSVIMTETKYIPGLTNVSASAENNLAKILAEQE